MRASRISKIGWCVGCNPPFVDCGIRLIGLPAPSGRFFIGVCLPFPLAGRPFHRFHPASSTLSLRIMVNCTGGRFVSAPLPRLSPSPLKGVQFYAWAEFPQALHTFRGSKATHQLASPQYNAQPQPIRITPTQPFFHKARQLKNGKANNPRNRDAMRGQNHRLPQTRQGTGRVIH